MLQEDYSKKINELLSDVEHHQMDVIRQVSKRIADSIQKDGLVHLFGCGHSHMLVEEVFFRAGGLVPVNPMFETSTMLHEGAVKSSQIEKMQGYAEHILKNYRVKEGEVIIIISTSGINSLPIEMAMEAKEKGLTVVALTSTSYRDKDSRHPSDKKLENVADYVIDNMIPYGDALVEIGEDGTKMGPGSTVIGAYVMNSMMMQVVKELKDRNIDPPVFVSGNVEGGMEYNHAHIEKYKNRIKHL